jgi:hypothetical protein
MAVIKKSSSGRAFQVVLSEDLPAGSILQCSSKLVEIMLSRDGYSNFIVLTRLALGTGPDKFPCSPVWGDVHSDANVGTDAFSKQFKKEREQRKLYTVSKKVSLE